MDEDMSPRSLRHGASACVLVFVGGHGVAR